MTMPEFKQLVDEVKKGVREIDPLQLKSMSQSGEEFALIDVREPDEWQKGTIPGAVTIARGMLEPKIDQVTTDKDKKIVLYCAGGMRSALAADMLQKMGFRNVLSLAGGYKGWVDSGQGK